MRTPSGYHIVSNGTDFFGIDELDPGAQRPEDLELHKDRR